MQYYDNETNENPEPLLIDVEMKLYLYEYGKWGKILAIISFIGLAVIAMAVIFGILFTSTSGEDFARSFMPFPEMVILFLYLLFLFIYFIPTLYLYRSTTSVRKALRLNDEYALMESFRNLKNLFKFLVMFVIAGIGLYALAVGVFFYGSASFFGF